MDTSERAHRSVSAEQSLCRGDAVSTHGHSDKRKCKINWTGWGLSWIQDWQRGGGYDHNLWSTDKVWEKIDYVHANPVKRELVTRPQHWF